MEIKRTFLPLIAVAALLAGAGCEDPAQRSAAGLQQAIDSLKSVYAPDARVAVWEVEAKPGGGTLTLSGKVDRPEWKQAILGEAARRGLAAVDSITLLDGLRPEPWAIVKLSVASMRTDGRHSAEMATQAIMGTPVRLLEPKNDWYRAQTPDGYIAYVPANSLELASQERLAQWKQAERYIVTAYSSRLVETPGGDATVSDLVLGNILELRGQRAGWVKLATPDGREGYVPATDAAPLSAWAKQGFDAALVEATARRMNGSGYLWGGTSTKVTDCSGLAKVCYFACGIILQRDASQQALCGTKIAAADWNTAQTGDLLFFGSSTGRVTHVGIYLRDGKYIHCSGRVKVNSVDPADDDYLSTPFISISRIDGCVGQPGITAVREHPWYF